MSTKYELKKLTDLLAALTVEERERFVMEQLKSMTELPQHNAQKIETIWLYELSDAINERYKNFGKFQGLGSGFRFIDRFLTKGFVGGEMTVLAGATSNGKTAMSINMANRIAQNGHTVLFVTLEMTQEELGTRFQKVNNGRPLADTNLPIMVQKNDELDWRDVDGLIEKAKRDGAEIVFIDHLHYFTRDTEHQNEALARISKEIKKNAIRHNIPIVLLAQTRKSTGAAKGEISNEEISGSYAIAQDADIVLFVKRDPEKPDDILLQMTKNRNRGHDFRNDNRYFSFIETVISDPEYDILIDENTFTHIDDYRNPFDVD